MTDTDFTGLNASLVSDAMEKIGGFDFAKSHELTGFTPITGKAALGYAYTIRVRRAVEKKGDERQRWFAAIDDAPAGAMFVIQADEDVQAAVFGEMVALRLHTTGLAGAIVDGYSRDIQQIRDIGFAYWTRLITPRGMSPIDADLQAGVSLSIRGVTVNAGDLIAADADGVFVCPAAQATEVLAISRTFRDAEVVTQEQVRKGARLFDVYPSKASIQIGSTD